jgi:protein-disulfide isomerase
MRRFVSNVVCFCAAAVLLGLGHAAGPSWAAEPRVGRPVELTGRPVLGVNTAPVLVVEISNFKCTQCRKFHENVFPTLRKDYIDTGKIQWVVVNASDDESEQYGKIFSIARCAQRQGKYWELLDGLFSVANRAPSVLEALVAKSPLLDRSELEICLQDRGVRSAVAKDFELAARLKIRGTPTFVISKWSADGKRTESTIAGAQPLAYFQRAFDDLLKKP